MGSVLSGSHFNSSKSLPTCKIDTQPENCPKELLNTSLPTFVDFFAGSGLVTQGAKHACTHVWSNDICPKKAAIYTANNGPGHFHLDLIEHSLGSVPASQHTPTFLSPNPH